MSRLVSYRCSKCKRLTTFQDNPFGFATLGSCNITKNCTGELVPISKTEARMNPTTRSMENDLVAWYPRRCLHKHSQLIARKNWVVNHNLDVHPQVVAYDASGNQRTDFTVTYPSRSITYITFSSATSGTADLIARTSQPDYDVAIPTSGVPNTAIDAKGVLTIATLTPINQPIVGTLRFYNQIDNSLLQSIPTTFIFNTTSNPTSAWYNYSYVRFNGYRYNVRQLDISSLLHDIPDQCYFRFTLGTQYDSVFLLTDAPYESTDANSASNVPYAFVESANGSADTRVVSNTLYVTSRFVDAVVAGIAKTV